MPLSGPLRVGLFPAGGAIVENLQIGRSRVIEQITTHALGGETQFLAEDRHLGKSSVLLAMVNRALREPADGGLVLSVDVRDGISSSGKLAQDLLAQAIQQNAGSGSQRSPSGARSRGCGSRPGWVWRRQASCSA
jgi:hypothetical protein